MLAWRSNTDTAKCCWSKRRTEYCRGPPGIQSMGSSRKSLLGYPQRRIQASPLNCGDWRCECWDVEDGPDDTKIAWRERQEEKYIKNEKRRYWRGEDLRKKIACVKNCVSESHLACLWSKTGRIRSYGQVRKDFQLLRDFDYFHLEVLFERKIKYEVAGERESSENTEAFLSFMLIFNFTYNMYGQTKHSGIIFWGTWAPCRLV